MTKKKIYLSPSDQTNNAYAYGNTNEAVQCRKISDAVETALERTGAFSVKNNKTDSMADRVKESNEWNADLHMCLHTNAFNKKTKGTRIFCYSKTGEGYKAALAVYKVLAPFTPGESENVSVNASLYEVKNTNAPCVYVEVEFHDVASNAKWIIEHTTEIGEVIAEGVCDHFGVTYKKPSTTAAKKTTTKVKTSKYAKKIKKYLKATGYFDGTIDNKVTTEYTKAIKTIQNKYFKRAADRDGKDGPNTLILAQSIYNMRGIKYFDLSEVRCNCGKCTGYPAAIDRQLMLNMDDLREKNGKITITSGIRCKHKNNSLSGSSSTSRHLRAKALDFYNKKLTATKSKRNATVKKWYSYPKANYSYANTPGMGNAVHVDVK